MDTVSFPSLVSRGCGIDVHKKVVVATIDGSGLRKETRELNTFTSSLTELKEWLLASGVTHVAMEGTGVYWKPVYKVLEPAGLTVWIVNARHIKYVPGHKTDKADSAYHILKGTCEYKEQGAEYVNSKMEKKRKAYLKKELEKLGYEVGLVLKEKQPESA